MAADMRLPTVRNPVSLSVSSFDRKDLVVPGDVITSDTGFMRSEHYMFVVDYYNN